MEYFPLVDEEGNLIGQADRETCHSGNFLLHPVVHLHVLNSKKEVYLQKRAQNKDIQPGKWDTSVGGHIGINESVTDALVRETSEELGINGFDPVFVMKYKFISEVESELVYVFYTIFDGKIEPNKEEIETGRFWTTDEIVSCLGTKKFTPNFESEFKMIMTNGLIPLF